MSLAYSRGMSLGTVAPAFTLPGVDGRTYSLASFSEAGVLVVVFTCNHCPYAVANEDRLNAIQRAYADRGVALVAISSNDARAYPEDSFDAMRVRAAEKAFPYPYLYDETQEVARAYDAACTPDVFVFDNKRLLVYNGRIDDDWQHPSRVTRHDLITAIEDTLAGRPLTFKPVAAMGCSIKWKHPHH